MSNVINSREARQNFFSLLRAANRGEPAVIGIDGIPVAAIVSYDLFKRWRTVEDLPPSNIADLERHALALAGQDPDKAALLLSEALTSLLSRQRERDDEQAAAK